MAAFIWLLMSCLCDFAHWQEIELNKAQWSALFEPYIFFEAYKNYLQVDIIAAKVDDLLAWKGWVESRLRQLTLKVKSVFKMLYNAGVNFIVLGF